MAKQKKPQGCVITPQESQRRLAGRTVKRIYSLDEVPMPAWAIKPAKKEVKNG